MRPRTVSSVVACAALLACTSLIASQQSVAPPPVKQRVAFKSGNLTLMGFLFKPSGAGPFPAVVWNHGSERNPGTGAQFDSVAAIFVPKGYVVFAPMRRGHGLSEGQYISDQVDAARRAQGPKAANRLVVHLLETEQLDDQLAFAISPAALSWAGNPLLRDRLVKAVKQIDMPVLLLQPPKDASLDPSRVLGAEFTRLRKAYTGKIYPATGPEDEQTHCFGGAKGMHVWADDAIAFLAGALHAR